MEKKTYTVVWEIEIEAESAEEAAKEALAIQRDPLSSALLFNVEGKDMPIDLWQEPKERLSNARLFPNKG